MIEEKETTTEIPIVQPVDSDDVEKDSNSENNDIITGNSENHHPHSDYSVY